MKIECPSCQQHIELQGASHAGKIENLDKQIEKLDGSAQVLAGAGVLLITLGLIVVAFVVFVELSASGWPSDTSVALSIAGSIIFLGVVCRFFARLGRIHLVLLETRADALRAASAQ